MPDDNFFMNDEIQENIDAIMESWLEIRGLDFTATDLKIEVFEQADMGFLYLVRFREKPIGCVLYLGNEYVVTRYFDYRGEEVGICL
mgnify:CR=1 FL=1